MACHRDLAPSTPCLLEVERLNEEQQVERLAAVASKELLSEVFLSSSAVHVRSVSHQRMGFSAVNAWATRLEELMCLWLHIVNGCVPKTA